MPEQPRWPAEKNADPVTVERLRLLLLIKGLSRGGAEQILVGTAAQLDQQRYDIHVAYVRSDKRELVDQLRALGIEVHDLSAPGSRWRWIPRLYGFLRAESFDVVHSHSPREAAIARLVPKRAGGSGSRRRRIVHTEHNIWSAYRRPVRLANAVTFWRNDAVIAVSQAVADSVWRHAGGPSSEVLHHGVDIQQLTPRAGGRVAARARLGVGPDVRLIGTVGNLAPKKDHRTLLAALERLHLVGLPARLAIIGGGPLEVELRADAEQRGISQHVIWLGLRDDVPALLPAFDVFCLSSLQEGLPLSLVEAMACGVPAVATDVGGTHELIVSEVTGLLVPPARPDLLAEALARVLRSEGFADTLAAAGQARAVHFDIRSAAERMDVRYRELLDAE